jgi:hypothetical protein
MATDTSATVRHEAPHTNRTTRTATIINALKRRAQAVLNDTSIDPQSRAIIRSPGPRGGPPWLPYVSGIFGPDPLVLMFASLNVHGRCGKLLAR